MIKIICIILRSFKGMLYGVCDIGICAAKEVIE